MAKKTKKTQVKHKIITKEFVSKGMSQGKKPKTKKISKLKKDELKIIEDIPASLYLSHNTALRPPYQVLVDTSFLNASIRQKVDLFEGMTSCLFAKCVPHITDCVMCELEKYGRKFSLSLKIAKDPRIERMKCTHTTQKGYADDCIVNTVKRHRCFIVATNDKELRQRLRKIPGVPIIGCN
ncbi:rRNA-processing protein Fcf1/Utp23 like protein [Aduncisulcus paluster]|uniref:rRNA-processing protein Fcf1/Utp23 like protein n=1 Tax=Aduncisulcus paluster TaxID=2918883 RepID=A0ABQ5JTG6_9EUKA|nr:rRNA-processing protein Fcf1/Utp23 like protein [Aduncisulcus paluster]